MRKRDIEELARRQRELRAAQNAQERPQARSADTDNKSPDEGPRTAPRGEFCALADVKQAMRETMLEFGPVVARLAAVDTIHTTERSDTLFRRAINEGTQARDIMRELEDGK